MKNYITVAALLAAGTAFANAYTVETDSTFYTNPNSWVYVWTGRGADTNWGTAGNWATLRSPGASSTQAADNGPAAADPVFIGYDLSFADGSQVLTSNNEAITVSVPSNFATNENRTVYLGSNVTLSGVDNIFQGVTFNFGDFSGASTISMGQFWKWDFTVSFAGDVTMTGDTFSYTLFSATKMYQNAGTWDATDVSVTDASGNKLTYTTDEALFGTAGYYWLEETGEASDTGSSPFTLTLKAAAIPEPSAFGLLAGLGALALVASRRRRR